MKRLNLFAPLLLAAIFFFNDSSAQGGFIKMGDIKGESTDASHKDWIVIESFSQAMSKPGGAGTGAARRRGAVVLEDIVITKKLDISSPKLMESITRGMVIPEVKIELVQSGRKPYYTIVLTNVIISSISSSGACSSQCDVTEQVSLSFERITWTYVDSKGMSVNSSYNAEKAM